MNHVLNGTQPKSDARLLADIAAAPDVHGVGFGVVAPMTDYNRGRSLRVTNSAEWCTTVAIRENRNFNEVLRGWDDADREYSDAAVTPDPYDGGCPADCQPLTKRPVAPVRSDAELTASIAQLASKQRENTEARIKIARVRGMYDAMHLLERAGHLEAAVMIADAAGKAGADL